MARIGWRDVVDRLDLPAALSAFDAPLAGTPPLGLDLPTSDIDVVCHAADGGAFADRLWAYGSTRSNFRLHQWVGGERAIVASFQAFDWTIEIFGSARPVEQQNGWRHFGQVGASPGAMDRRRAEERRRSGAPGSGRLTTRNRRRACHSARCCP